MGLEAYRRVQKVAESPRETEYRLFAQVTGALLRAKEQALSGAELVDALDWNRRLWSTLSTDCSLPGNNLPDSLRAQIISLSLWVSRYSSDVAARKADIDALIDVNKAIMEGLAMREANAAAAQAQGGVRVAG
jgi:flagellar biosynthesis activator protein FlaF